MMINRYTVNKALVQALYKLSKNPGKSAGELRLSRVEYSVYTKLKWWDLIVPTGEDGVWRVTDKGRRFLSGKEAVPRQIGYFRNKLCETSVETLTIFQVFPTEESRQKYRELMSVYGAQ